MVIERDERWHEVEPGYEILPGQPYRIEFSGLYERAAHERRSYDLVVVPVDNHTWLIDSTWAPPIDLPTEPTWAIVVEASAYKDGSWLVDEWHMGKPNKYAKLAELMGEHVGLSYEPSEIAAFVPLTEDQIQDIKEQM